MRSFFRFAPILLIAAVPAAAQTTDPETPPALGETAGATLDLDTPIAALIADSRSRAVLDKDMPGLSTDENLDKFKAKSLRELQPLTGGRLTDALLKKVGEDLAAID